LKNIEKISNSFQPSCFKAALGIVKEERKKGRKEERRKERIAET